MKKQTHVVKFYIAVITTRPSNVFNNIPLIVMIYIWYHVIDKYVVCINLIKCFTENLALHRPTWQSSTWLSGYSGADRAVDGQYTELLWSEGQCASSLKGQTAEWRGDLGGVKNIHHGLIQYMTDNRVWGILSFKLIHSN